MFTAYLPVAGTHGWNDNWWKPDSRFANWMANRNFRQLRHMETGLPFRWSTDVNGWRFWRPQRHSDWEAGGDALAYFLSGFPLDDRNVIAHSHGGQVALYAAARGLRIRTLVTVGSPVRADMGKVIAQARPMIGQWLHLYDLHWDLWQAMGQVGDGRVAVPSPVNRIFPAADQNCGVPGIKHSRVLTDPKAFYLWTAERWLDWLRAPAGIVA